MLLKYNMAEIEMPFVLICPNYFWLSGKDPVMPGKGLFMVCGSSMVLICAVAALSFPATMSSFQGRIRSLGHDPGRLLDSLDWARIKQFYVQPVNVPSGELQYLKN